MRSRRGCGWPCCARIQVLLHECIVRSILTSKPLRLEGRSTHGRHRRAGSLGQARALVLLLLLLLLSVVLLLAVVVADVRHVERVLVERVLARLALRVAHGGWRDGGGKG